MKVVAATATVVGVTLAMAVPVLAGSNSRPHPVQVQTAAKSVNATLGSYCVSHTTPHSPHVGTGLCADSAYPLRVKGRLSVRGEQRIAFRMHDLKITRVSLALLKVHDGKITSTGAGGFSAHQRPGHPARWIAKLPTDLGQANRLDIFLSYKHGIGDADYWAGLRVTRF